MTSDIAAVVLAAGKASRFAAAGATVPSKMVAVLDGKPLVRRVVETALQSHCRPVVVVTGHASQAVRSALAGLPVAFVHNPRFGDGIATSVRAGIAAVPEAAAGAAVLLGDMPGVTGTLLDRLVAAFESRPTASAVVPVHAGVRGNPVLLARSLFGAVGRLAGDQGARAILAGDPSVVELEVGEAAVGIDVDTPEDLARAAHERLRFNQPSAADPAD